MPPNFDPIPIRFLFQFTEIHPSLKEVFLRSKILGGSVLLRTKALPVVRWQLHATIWSGPQREKVLTRWRKGVLSDRCSVLYIPSRAVWIFDLQENLPRAWLWTWNLSTVFSNLLTSIKGQPAGTRNLYNAAPVLAEIGQDYNILSSTPNL